jgi:type I site-specific restriction-modification system R (restriction) subunit
MMRARKKKKTGLDMVRPTLFYSNESEKIKLNWFCYELSMGIYDNMKKEIGSRLEKQKISDKALAEFSVYYSKEMKNMILQQLSGKIKTVCISYEPIESYFPDLDAGLINKMTDVTSDAWDEMLSICEVCPNRCISEKDAYCTLFDDKFLFK